MHDDKPLGFKGKCPSFFFGKKGDWYVSRPRFKIYPNNKSTNLSIYAYDFEFFHWPISIVLDDIFDEYDTYEFTKEQWNNILNEAENILKISKFDDLFNYLLNFPTSISYSKEDKYNNLNL